MVFFGPWSNTELHNCKLKELGIIALKPINVLMMTGEITKNATLTTTFHKLTGEENLYVWFGYFPLNICYHNRGQVSVSMNSDPINMIHTSQK